MPLTAIPDASIKQPILSLGNVRGFPARSMTDKSHQLGGIHGSKESTQEISEKSTNKEGNSGKVTDDQVGDAGPNRSEHGFGQETGLSGF